MPTSVQPLPPATIRFRSLTSALIFLLGTSLLTFYLFHRALPKPLYLKHKLSSTTPYLHIGHSSPLIFKVNLPEFPDKIAIPVRVSGKALEITIVQAGSEHSIHETITASSDRHVIDLPRSVRKGGELQISFSSSEQDPEKMPQLLWSERNPIYHAENEQAGTIIKTGSPILDFEFYRIEKYYAFLSLLSIPLAFLAYSRERFFYPFLIFLGLSVTLLSILLWQQDYSHHFGHWDADSYGLYASKLASYATHPESRKDLSEWFASYPHAHTFLFPVIIAPFVILGLPSQFVYLTLSSLSSFLTVLVIWNLQADIPRTPDRLGFHHDIGVG
jgi:hypothetical protein